MARIEDQQFGRGRQDDSSSSRESSPRRPHGRSFTPTSDDGDLVVPPIADDDTPPPPERPLLRQPVAFAWNNSSSIAAAPTELYTYQATIPPTSTPSSAYFLPGQEVPLPPPPAPRGRSGPKAKKGDGATKKKRTTDYSAQTGRFRLQPYDPTPSTEPPTQQGAGPYGSMFRGAASTSHTTREVSSPAPNLPGYTTPSDGTNTMASSSSVPDRSSARDTQRLPERPAKQKEKQTGNRSGQPSRARAKAKASGKAKASATAGMSVVTPETLPHQQRVSSSKSSSSTGGYYRRNYERDTVVDPGLNSRRSPFSDPHDSDSRGYSAHGASNPSSGAFVSPRGEDEVLEPQARRGVRRNQLVTILIQDIRSGTTDHQLAEVRVALRTAEDPAEGSWANALELGQKLQASPCRIDGPAKVYTLRGKYRQFFLRVSAENVDEFMPANLVIDIKSTIKIVVETILPPGTLPLPPQIPKGARSLTPSVSSQYDSEEVARHQSPSFDPIVEVERRATAFVIDKVKKDARKRLRQSSRSSSDEDSISHVTSSRRRSTHESLRGREKRPKHNSRGYDSPKSDDEPDKVHELVSKATDSIIQEDPGWEEFFKNKAAKQNASHVVKQYQFVQRMMDTWVGRRVPFRTRHNIEPSHILKALHIDDPMYSSNCAETLDLLKLYGIGGQRCENPHVVDLLNDDGPVPYNAKIFKRLLHLLRDVDETWNTDHQACTPDNDD